MRFAAPFGLVPLLLAACAGSASDSADPLAGSQSTAANGAPAQDSPSPSTTVRFTDDTSGQSSVVTETNLGSDVAASVDAPDLSNDLEMGPSDVDVDETRARIASVADAMEESFEQPYDLAEFVDIVGSGQVKAVRQGRRYVRDGGAGEFARTTLVIAVDELVRGEANDAGLVYVEFTHSPDLASGEVALGLPEGAQVVFFASDVSDFAPNDAILSNWEGGRPAGSGDPIFVAHAQGLWVVAGGGPASLLEPVANQSAAWQGLVDDGDRFEAEILRAAQTSISAE